MLRRLLTLLAVISGFTLAVEPARAGQSDVVSMAQAADQAESHAVTARPALRAARRAVLRRAHCPAPCAAPLLAVPAVLIRIDRAHE